MALFTVQRSPNNSDSPSLQDEKISRPRLQKRDSFLMGQGTALLFPAGESPSSDLSKELPITKVESQQRHLETMCGLLRQDDEINLAVRLESIKSQRIRYLLLVSSTESESFGESAILGVDITEHISEKACTIGMVLPIWSDTHVFLDGDGGFSVTSAFRTYIFKPVNVQAMWTVLQALHSACEESVRFNHYPGGTSLLWANFYTGRIESPQSCINEWNTMCDLLSIRPESPRSNCRPTDRDQTERLIRANLRVIMMDMDLYKATSKEIRMELESHMNQDLNEFKGFIDNEMLLVLAQMDKPSKIFDYLYLGSEWNASNFEELERNGVGFILNVTREIDNFFPDRFQYLNIRVYDEEVTELLSHWEQSYRFITIARASSSKCLVHCKMGVSRSASTVMAFAMKQYGWTLDEAYSYVKERRGVSKPNAGFLTQLRIYQGILNASKQRHNCLWRSHSETDLSELSEEAVEDRGPRRSQDDSGPGTKQTAHPPRPQSPSGGSPPTPGPPSPRPDSPPPYHFRPLRDEPPSPPASPRPPSAGGPAGDEGRGPVPRPPRPLTPSLREKIDLLTLMWQVKEMERRKEGPEGLPERPPARAWRRRACSVQVPGAGSPQLDWSRRSSLDVKDESPLETPGGAPAAVRPGEAGEPRVRVAPAGGSVPPSPRSPETPPRGEQRRTERGARRLAHCQAVDLTEEEEAEGPTGEGPGDGGRAPSLV